MNSLRTTIASILVFALALGYGLSQKAFFSGTYPEYYAQIDQPLVRWMALAAIALCVAFAMFGNEKDRSES